jgi:copper resistance protein D
VGDPLIWWRAVHFAATISLAGTICFLAFVAEPVFASVGEDTVERWVRRTLGRLAWASLVLAIVSGAGWLIAVAQQLSEGSLSAVLRDRIAWIVLTKTAFGTAWTLRLSLALIIAACLPLAARPLGGFRAVVALGCAALLVGGLAFAGHAGTGDDGGAVHLWSDIAHLVAAAAWVGALVPLAILLGAVGRSPHEGAMTIAGLAVQRFSTLGLVSVGVLTASGIVNTWYLAGSIKALTGTEYGRLLLVKVALFVVMVAVAAVNRRVLTPRLVADSDVDALRRLRNNSLIEATIGAVILLIVGALGTLQPGLHDEL